MTYDALRTDGEDDRLIVTLHGIGADASQFHGAAQAMLPGAHVVSPKGDVETERGLGFHPAEPGSKYDVEALAEPAAALALFVAEEAERTGARTVLGMGYDNGANVLAAAAFLKPELFDAIALLHPHIPYVPKPVPGLSQTRVLITAGQEDPDAPEDVTRNLAGWFMDQKADVIFAIHPGGHEIPQSEVDALRDFLA